MTEPQDAVDPAEAWDEDRDGETEFEQLRQVYVSLANAYADEMAAMDEADNGYQTALHRKRADGISEGLSHIATLLRSWQRPGNGE